MAEVVGLSESTAQRYARRGDFDPRDIHSVVAYREARARRSMPMDDAMTISTLCCPAPDVELDHDTAPRPMCRCRQCGAGYLPVDYDFEASERRLVALAMLDCGSISKAAGRLGMTRHRLRRLLQRHDMYRTPERPGQPAPVAGQWEAAPAPAVADGRAQETTDVQPYPPPTISHESAPQPYPLPAISHKPDTSDFEDNDRAIEPSHDHDHDQK